MAIAGLTQHDHSYSVPTLKRASDVFQHPTDVSGIWCRGGTIAPRFRRHSSLLPMRTEEGSQEDMPPPLSPTES